MTPYTYGSNLQVMEPAVLQMEPANQMKALQDVLEGQLDNGNDFFLITFQHQADMENFFKLCVDEENLENQCHVPL